MSHLITISHFNSQIIGKLGFLFSSSSSVEMVGLEDSTPFPKLCGMVDSPFASATCRQIG
jgi:hypothetical protein